MYECIERVSSSCNDKIYVLKKKEIEIINRTREMDKRNKLLSSEKFQIPFMEDGKKGRWIDEWEKRESNTNVLSQDIQINFY